MAQVVKRKMNGANTARALDTSGTRRAVVLAGDGEQTDEAGKAIRIPRVVGRMERTD